MTNYARGADFEREIRTDLTKNGWYAVRSAGSHGAVDVLAFNRGLALFVQAKRNGAFPPGERKSLLEIATKHGACPVLALRRKGAIHYYIVDDSAKMGEEFRPF